MTWCSSNERICTTHALYQLKVYRFIHQFTDLLSYLEIFVKRLSCQHDNCVSMGGCNRSFASALGDLNILKDSRHKEEQSDSE